LYIKELWFENIYVHQMNLIFLLLKVCIIPALLGFVIPDKQTAQTTAKESKQLNIGLLVQDNNSLTSRYAAEMAIENANNSGGYNGIPFKLVDLSMEGPWGSGSKQAVSLIFDKKVVAILGSCDGRNAHLVEQVSAKTRVIFMSAWSGDPTLSRAFVPWFFNCVPNYIQQADALFEEVCITRSIEKIVLVSDSSYDSKLALNCLATKIKSSGKPDPEIFFYKHTDSNFDQLDARLNKDDIGGIVLLGQQSAFLNTMNHLELRKIKPPVFGSLSVMDEREFDDKTGKIFENSILLTSGHWFNEDGVRFRRDFKIKYGYTPGPAAAYAFDGMNLLIKAIKASGTEREDIQKYLREVSYKGITGTFRFDNSGNRIGEITLVEIKNSNPVKVGKY